MFNFRHHAAILALGTTLWLSACGGKSGTDGVPDAAGNPAGPRHSASAAKVLNLFIWSDYLAPKTLSDFEKQTGIKVTVAYYDNNQTLEARLLAGHSGFDVVVPTAPFFERQIRAEVYRSLDKSRLPNLRNMDPQLMNKVSLHDPDNAHGVIYMWGTFGVGYNAKMIKALFADAPFDSWRLIFDPAVSSRLARCGIGVLDKGPEMMRVVLLYLGRDPNSQKVEDLAAAEATLTKIRPYIRTIDSSNLIQSLANGDLCVVIDSNGEVMQARARAREANQGMEITYRVPKEGSVLWFDMLAVPKDASNPDSAYAFMNYMMTPSVIAEVSNFVRFANANAAAEPLVSPAVREDPVIYAPLDLRQSLAPFLGDTPEQTRAITRMWQRFKAGQ